MRWVVLSCLAAWLLTPNGAWASRTVYIDPVSANAPSGWNNVSFVTTNASAVLVDAQTNSTGIRLTVVVPLQGPNGIASSSPTGDAAEFAPAGANSAYGNTNVWGGKVIPLGLAVFSNLSANTAYTFTFYASRTGVSDNREALYTMTGSNSGSNTLNASGNSSRVAVVSNITPRADGTISLRLERGANNNETNGFYYLTAMKVVYEEAVTEPPAPQSVIYVDACGTNAASGWNLFRMNQASDVMLRVTNGISSGIRARVTVPFASEGVHATSWPTGEAAEFALAGDNECYGASSAHVYATLSGMNPTNAYTFTFYAQRAGGSGTREALYTVTGVNSNSATLDAADNTQDVAVVRDILPSADGSMTLHISRGANNTAGYFYLNAFKITYPLDGGTSAPAPVAESPKRLLFFGNSFSLVDDVPGHVASLAELAGHPRPLVVADLMGGQDLAYQISQIDGYPANNVTNGALAGTNTWDHVVIQGYSTEATHLRDPVVFKTNAVALFQRVRNHTSGKGAGVGAVLYETWARAPGHSYYPDTFADPAAMQLEIRTNYQGAAALIAAAEPAADLRTAPVGDAFERGGFALDFYGADLYHAGNLGPRLSALILYKTIYGATVTNLPYAAAVAAGWTTMSSNDWTRVTYLAEGLTPPASTGGPTNGAPPAATGFGAREVFLLDAANADAAGVSGWNCLNVYASGSASLVTTNGLETDVSCAVVTRMNGLNTNGSPAPTGEASAFAPAGANNAYGNVNPFGSYSNAYALLRFSGLNPRRRYTLTFFASRVSATDNREALYTVTGSTSGAATLDAANNSSNVVRVSDALPRADGTLDVRVEPGPNNTNAYKFYHLSAIRIESVRMGFLFLIGP